MNDNIKRNFLKYPVCTTLLSAMINTGIKSPQDYSTNLAKLHNRTVFALKDLSMSSAACGWMDPHPH